ncbi:YdcH family protein [Roseicella aerolata]
MPRRGRNSMAVPACGDRVPHSPGRCRMNNSPRLRSLEERHAVLDRQIGEEDARPRPDEAELTRLKREKLRLKEEMERLRRQN